MSSPLEPSTVRTFAELLPSVTALRADPKGRLSAADRAEEEAREAGFAEGYASGLAAGLDEGRIRAYEDGSEAAAAEVRRIALELDALGATVQEATAAWYKGAEESLAQLSMEIARRIVGKELELGEDAILSITREALREVTHSATARIRVNPMHSGVLEGHRELILSLAPSLKHVEIVGDDAISGGCVIETEGGLVDASTESKIRGLRQAAGWAA